MKHVSNVRGNSIPSDIQIMNNNIIISSNVHEYSETNENGNNITGYEYDCDIYTKDQYILLLSQNQAKIDALEDQLQAAKILLGVD